MTIDLFNETQRNGTALGIKKAKEITIEELTTKQTEEESVRAYQNETLEFIENELPRK